MKSQWNAPQLVMLVRGKPQESVLVSCKTGEPVGLAAQPSGAPSTTFGVCYQPANGPAPQAANCLACQAVSVS